jgi:hypothetical protein
MNRLVSKSGMRNRLVAVCLLAALVAAATAVYATDFAVIVNPINATKTMGLADLGKIFRGKTAAWATGNHIILVLRDSNSPGMKFVIEKVMGVSLEEGMVALNEANRGKSGASVVFVSSDEDVIKLVAGSATAIGIIDVYNITSGVKLVKIDDKQPLDPGYVLKGRSQ